MLEEKINEAGGSAEVVTYEKYEHIDIVPGLRIAQEEDHVLDKILEFLDTKTAS